MTCNELVELATTHLDGALHPERRAAINHHLLHCRCCVNYLEQWRITVHTVGRLGAESLNAALPQPLARRVSRCCASRPDARRGTDVLWPPQLACSGNAESEVLDGRTSCVGA